MVVASNMQHAQYTLLFLVMAVNSTWSQILWSYMLLLQSVAHSLWTLG